MSKNNKKDPSFWVFFVVFKFIIYQFNNQAKISGATIVASDSTINFGVLMSSFPHVIFSFGTAPEYEP